MTQRQMEAWKTFFRGEISREQGHGKEALESLEEAIELDPQNPHFRKACDAARSHLDMDLSPSEEHHLAQILQSYERLSRKTVNATSERLDGLKDILSELEGPSRKVQKHSYKGGLHSWSDKATISAS